LAAVPWQTCPISCCSRWHMRSINIPEVAALIRTKQRLLHGGNAIDQRHALQQQAGAAAPEAASPGRAPCRGGAQPPCTRHSPPAACQQA
jgi:hypothetical protein